MAIVAEFTIPPEALPFGDTLIENPDIKVEVERIVPTDESALPFFWVWGDNPEVFMNHSEREPDVRNTHQLAEVENGALFRAEWSPNATLIDGLKDLKATIIESEGTADQWRFQVRATTRDRIIEFRRVLVEEGIDVALKRLYHLSEVVEANQRALTEDQRHALIAAYREGYYNSPKEISQQELGEQFGISHRAISERLRRGTRNLIASSLISTDERE